MKPDLQSELRNLKFTHLTENELAAYCDQKLDQMSHARVEAHVGHCFICARELELLREESLALDDHAITAEDIAFVERLAHQFGPEEEHYTVGPATPVIRARAAMVAEPVSEYSHKIVANWQVVFSPLRPGDHTDEVWRWQSDDGQLHARATQKKDTDLTIHFSTGDMKLEGALLRFCLRSLKQEVTLRRVSESRVGAQVIVPQPYPQGYLATISVEIG